MNDLRSEREQGRGTVPLEGGVEARSAGKDQRGSIWFTVPRGHEPSPASGLMPSGEVAIPPQASAENASVSTSPSTTINVLRRVLRTFILPTSCSFVCGYAKPASVETIGFMEPIVIGWDAILSVVR